VLTCELSQHYFNKAEQWEKDVDDGIIFWDEKQGCFIDKRIPSFVGDASASHVEDVSRQRHALKLMEAPPMGRVCGYKHMDQ
jgi:hypothetical protein